MNEAKAGQEVVRPSVHERRPGRTVRVRDRVGGVEHTRLYEAVDAAGCPILGPRVAVVGLMHGNEPVGRFALERFSREAPEQLIAGGVLAVVANPEAEAMVLRHTPDGRDMNRLWDQVSLDRLAGTPDDVLVFEERRVKRLAPLLLECDAVLDLHSTSRPSPPHLVLRDDLRHAAIAERLGVQRLVTGVHEAAILDGGLCANVGLGPGEVSPRLGFTLEAGQHLDPRNAEAAWQVVVRLLRVLEMWSGPPPQRVESFEIYEVQSRFLQAPEGSEPFRFVGYVGGEPGGERFGPPRQLESFEDVEADEVLLRRGTAEVVRAQGPFTMLMPAPTAEPGGDLFYFTQRRHAALQVRPTTDRGARTEARAIERMLDLLADDEYQRGVSHTTFEARRTLDLCADWVGRVCRLPPGHPHRRIVVVGRGEWELGEVEERVGQRYQLAMKRAMQEGVRIERMQLLRGAALGWLRELAHGMAAAGDEADMRLFVSAREPHTISLLLMGDPELALAEGDLRHVRAALVVEAATVVPDGERVHTRIARAGLFGARPELIDVAADFVRTLREEHRTLVSSTPFGEAAWRAGLVHEEDGSLRAVDGEVLHGLLGELQLASFREVLQLEVTRETSLASEADIGRWLARTMARTGVMDVRTLRGVLHERDEGGWVVSPSALERLQLPAEPPEPERTMPPAVLDATDVDRENIERWIGWKRFVREASAVPGNRGKDVDLAFTGDEIRSRMADWFDDARQRAQQQPGRWLVVAAGDGLQPLRDTHHDEVDVLAAHHALIREPGVRYRRIQHAQSTHMSWLKGLLQQLGERPAGGMPVSIGWEAEHGASINVLLIASCDDPPRTEGWSLEGWSIRRCAVVLSQLDGTGTKDDQLALFTERTPGQQPNLELLHFGRVHCEGLMRQASSPLTGVVGPHFRMSFKRIIVALLARWLDRTRAISLTLAQVAPFQRHRWLANHLGIVDEDVVARLVAEASTKERSIDVARRIWDEVEAWLPPSAH